ncbi:hypothetical protein IL306_004224 [Fusarium sp. DS 682]|nr:hypothetical protein IL306_004224 [Fusarium sp. DS 682]
MSSSPRLRGQHILVIGGTNGIGRGVALAAVQDAAKVTIVGSSQATVDKAVKHIKNAHPPAEISGLSCDLDKPSLEEDLDALFKKIDQIHHVVLTASNSIPRQISVQNMAAKDLVPAHKKLQTMVLLAKVTSRYLPLSRHSSLTLTSGSIADHPVIGSSVLSYIAQGTVGMIRGLALDMKPVRVNVVEPGYVLETGLWSEVPAEQVSELRGILAKKNPTGSEGMVEDVAEAYMYLMKDGNCTGEVIKTRSGQHLV